MHISSTQPSRRRCRIAGAALLAAGVLGACGDDDAATPSGPARLDVTMREFKLDTGGVRTLPAGPVTISARNTGRGEHGLVVMRLQPGVSLARYTRADPDRSPGMPVTGTYNIAAGRRWQATLQLPAGRYALEDIGEARDGSSNSRDHGMIAALEMTKTDTPSTDVLPHAAASITLRDRRCGVPATLPRDAPIEIANRGRNFNSVGILRVRSEPERAAARRALTDRDPNTEPEGNPVDLAAETAPGVRVLIRTAIPAGDYVAACFAFDPKRGRPLISVANVQIP